MPCRSGWSCDAGDGVPADEIAVEACREWLWTHLRNLDVDRDVRIFPRLRPGSVELAAVFARGGDLPRANDTACGVGFSPLTDLERVVLEVEWTLNEQETKRTHPEIGEDIKVMATRHRNRVDLAVGCAFVSRFIAGAHDYVRKKESVPALVVDAPQVLDVEYVLVSEIGRVISDPRFVDVRLGIDTDDPGETLTRQVSDIVRFELDHLTELRDAILDSQMVLY